MAEASLGEFEFLVLLAVMRHRDTGFGLAVRDEILARTARAVSTGAVYTTLDRLERKGFLRSHLERGGPERDNRPRRRYETTATGLAAVRTAHAAIRAMSRGLRLGGAM